MSFSQIERSKMEVLGNILLWSKDRFGWEPRPKQDQILESIHQFQKICFRIGRQFGKTEVLALVALYLAWTRLQPVLRGGRVAGYRGSKVLMASAKDDWAETLYERTRGFMERNEEMRQLVREGGNIDRENQRGIIRIRLSPFKRILFPNGSSIDYRGPGDKGEGPRSKTYDFKIIDEADRMPKAYWIAERPTGINAPSALTILSSTPTGRRDFFYNACMNPSLGYKEFHFSGEENPNMTIQMKKELLEELGPEEYEREVNANWGVIMSGAFPADGIDAAVYTGDYLRLRVDEKEVDPVGRVEEVLSEWVASIGSKSLAGFLIGADLGTSSESPAEILIGEQNGDDLDVVGMITLHRLKWPVIEDIFGIIDQTIRVISMSLDATGVGAPLCENLMARGKLSAELAPLDFSTNLLVGEDLRKNAKVWATDALVSMLQRGNLGLPDNEDLIYQFRNHTVDLSRGRPKYSKVDDHMVDAARCLVYAFFKGRLDGISEKTAKPDTASGSAVIAGLKPKDSNVTAKMRVKMIGAR